MINSNFNLYSTGWLDIVFSNRNKAYGAYELRQQSSNYTLRALAITLFIFAAGITLITVLHKKVPDVKVTVVTITPQPILPPVTKKKTSMLPKYSTILLQQNRQHIFPSRRCPYPNRRMI